MSRYTKFAALTAVLAVFVAFPVFVSADATHDYAKKITGCWLGTRKLTFTTPTGHGASSATKTHPRTLAADGEWKGTSLSSRAGPMMVSLLLRTPLSRARTTR